VRFVRKRLRPRLLAVYALAAGIVLLAEPRPLTLALGALPVAAGVALRIWATGYLFKNDELTVAGPYAYLRHPLYLGTLLIATGFAIAAASALTWALFAIFLVGYFGYYMPYKDRIEAARLEELYGDAFCRYAVAVPRLLPRLHAYRPLAGDGSGTVRWTPQRFADNHELGTAMVAAAGLAVIAARWALA
jgi:protein-S-isoprenylcysteine O-methyltransferase Ste14